jgi:hypothetical protein
MSNVKIANVNINVPICKALLYGAGCDLRITDATKTITQTNSVH